MSLEAEDAVWPQDAAEPTTSDDEADAELASNNPFKTTAGTFGLMQLAASKEEFRRQTKIDSKVFQYKLIGQCPSSQRQYDYWKNVFDTMLDIPPAS